jgi:hypothetical protein
MHLSQHIHAIGMSELSVAALNMVSLFEMHTLILKDIAMLKPGTSVNLFFQEEGLPEHYYKMHWRVLLVTGQLAVLPTVASISSMTGKQVWFYQLYGTIKSNPMDNLQKGWPIKFQNSLTSNDYVIATAAFLAKALPGGIDLSSALTISSFTYLDQAILVSFGFPAFEQL